MVSTPSTASRPVALVTGASSGIGTELARVLAANGSDLVVVARRREKLETLAADLRQAHGVSVTVLPCDLARPGAAAALWNTVQAQVPAVDVLVNNAGIALSGPFAESDVEAMHTMVQLNVTALTDLTRAALPAMLQRRAGRILNLASLAGFQAGGPGMAAYYATKSYVLSFTRALARELRGTGVTATALCPGPTHTEMEQLAGLDRMKMFRWLRPMDARTVAGAGIEGMNAGRVVVVPGVLNRILSIAGRLPPAWLSIEVNRLLAR